MTQEMQPSQEVSADVNERFESWLNAPEEGAEEVAVEAEVDVEQAAEGIETEDSQEQSEVVDEADDSHTTLNIEGIEVSLPKDVAEKVTTIQKRLEADYTRKTQDAAELRRGAEQFQKTAQANANFQQQNVHLLVELKAAETQLKEYEQIDWGSLAEQDIGAYSKHKEIRDSLRQKHQQLYGDLNSRMAQVEQADADEKRQIWENTVAVVKKAIPSYNEETDKKSVATAIKLGEKYGIKIDVDQLSKNVDPLIWIGLFELSKYMDIVAKRPETNKQVAATIKTSKPPVKLAHAETIQKLLSQGRIREASQL